MNTIQAPKFNTNVNAMWKLMFDFDWFNFLVNNIFQFLLHLMHSESIIYGYT